MRAGWGLETHGHLHARPKRAHGQVGPRGRGQCQHAGGARHGYRIERGTQRRQERGSLGVGSGGRAGQQGTGQELPVKFHVEEGRIKSKANRLATKKAPNDSVAFCCYGL